MKLRYFLIPPSEINKLAVEFAGEVSKNKETYFVVDGIDLFPHMTLFKLNIKKENIDELNDLIKNQLNSYSPLKVHLQGFDLCPGGWFGLSVRPREQLDILQNDLVNTVKDSGIVQIDTGGREFDPHITLTKFIEEKDQKDVLKTHDPPDDEFVIDSIGAGLSNNHSQVTKILKEFKIE